MLLVCEDARWCRAVTERLRAHELEVWRAESLKGVRYALELAPIDAVLFDVRSLPAPAWFEAVELFGRTSPAPTVVAWGHELTPYEGFQLARLGVRQLVARRPTPEQARGVLAQATAARPVLEPHIRAHVGHEPLPDVIDRVRELFFDQALALTRGHRTRAAQLLGVTRQAVQQRVRSRESAEESTPAWPSVKVRRKKSG